MDTEDIQIFVLNVEHDHGKIQAAKLQSILSMRHWVYMILTGNVPSWVNTQETREGD